MTVRESGVMQDPKSNNPSDGTETAFNIIDGRLIVTLHPKDDDFYFDSLCDDVSFALGKSGCGVLIMDATHLELIDDWDFQRLRRVIDVAALMGTKTIIAGVRPGVAASIVELGCDIGGFSTALNLKSALRFADTEIGP